MKVEHLTTLGNSLVRDTKDIPFEELSIFRELQTGQSVRQETVVGMPFNIKVTIEKGIAIFDINKEDIILTSNVCCFKKEDSEAALMYVKDYTKGLPFLKNAIVRKPAEPMWLFSVPVLSFLASPLEMILAGKIELAVYESIRRGIERYS